MSLLIGIHIQDVLDKNGEIQEKVKNRIYPIVITAGTPAYPFIVYQNNGTQQYETKDGNIEDTVYVSVAIVSKTYDEAIRLGQTVRYAFEGVTRDYEEFRVLDCSFTGSSEEYMTDIDSFIITVDLSFKTLDL